MRDVLDRASFPASIFEKSSTSFTTVKAARCCSAGSMWTRARAARRSSASRKQDVRHADECRFIGVRISWLMLARNSDLARAELERLVARLGELLGLARAELAGLRPRLAAAPVERRDVALRGRSRAGRARSAMPARWRRARSISHLGRASARATPGGTSRAFRAGGRRRRRSAPTSRRRQTRCTPRARGVDPARIGVDVLRRSRVARKMPPIRTSRR